MTKVLITGATGNVGSEVLLSLNKLSHHLDIYGAVRNPKDQILKRSNNNITFIEFDFTDINTYKPALQVCEILFLLRSPQISQVEKYFKPLINTCLETSIRHIVFLSVQGVEKSKVIPHHKIEKIIVDSKILYTFLRPAYFMQNFTTTLRTTTPRQKEVMSSIAPSTL